MKLINTQDITTKAGATRYAVEAVIKDLKLKPVYEMKQGKGTIDIWDEDAVLQPIMDELRKREAAKAPPPAPVQAPPPLAPQPDLKPIFEEVFKAARRVDDALEDIENSHAEVLATNKKLVEQNVVLLRMLEDIRATTYSKIDALQATVDTMHDALMEMNPTTAAVIPPVVPTAAAPAPVKQAPASTPAEPLKKVAIVALLPDQKAMIEREFGKVLDLRIFSSDEARGNGSSLTSRLTNCDAVFVMNHFTDRTIHDQIKKAGIKPIAVSGGMTKLRDALTNLFLAA